MESKKKTVKAFGLFMAAMLVLTFLSRIIYVQNMPQIRWNTPSASSIRNTIKAEGTVEAVNSQAIMGINGLLVKKVCVSPGEPIEAGTVLYEVDLEDLQAKLAQLEADEAVWQKQVQAQKESAAEKIARAEQDHNIADVQTDRQIAEQIALLADAQEDLDKHLSRPPKEASSNEESSDETDSHEDSSDETDSHEDSSHEAGSNDESYDETDSHEEFYDEAAAEEAWRAWEDETVRLERAVEEQKRALEQSLLQKEKLLIEADRVIEDAKSSQKEVEGSYSMNFTGIGQILERENTIAAWKQLVEKEGRVTAGQEGTVLEVMLKSGMQMGPDAVIRYTDAQSSLVFHTVITQEEKAKLHTGDNVKLTFPGSSEEIAETIDSIAAENGSYLVTIRLEPGAAQGMTEGVMEAVFTSEVYDFVISRHALHNDGSTNYIYILEEKEGILGTELSVRSLTVRLLDENEDKVAIMDDLLDSDMKIIVESDKELKSGAAVKE